MIYLTPKQRQSFFYLRNTMHFFFTVKDLFKENRVWRIEQKKQKKKPKEDFLTALVTVIRKDPTTSVRKHAYELSGHKKTLRFLCLMAYQPL